MSDIKARLAEKKAKLAELHKARNQAKKLNHTEVVEEDRRNSEPKNMEARKRRAEYLLEEEEFKQQCEREGKDFEREKLRRVGADVAAAVDKRKRDKIDPDKGFSSFEDATARKYNQLVKANIKPDMERYEEIKEKMGEDAFYAESGSIIHGTRKDSQMAINRMAEDVKTQVAKRDKFSRRRMHDDDADIDYINERNMNFNRKLERFYGKYTKDIKDNLERGTAV